MSTNYRKLILDNLIAELAGLTHDSSPNLLFHQVKKIFTSFPTQTPVAEVTPTGTEYEVLDNHTDLRNYNFQIIVYDGMDESKGQAELETRIDRLQRIEDRVADYLEAIPNSFQGDLPSVKVSSIRINQADYNYTQSEQGIRLFLTMNLTIQAIVSVQ